MGGVFADLPRSHAAFEGLSTLLWNEDGATISKFPGPSTASTLDALLAPHLETALRVHAVGVLSLLRATPECVTLQVAGGRLISAAARHPALRALLLESGAGELLAAAVRRHPEVKVVQEHSQWALLCLAGHQPLVAVLRDPALSASVDVVKASVKSLHDWESWSPKSLSAISWSDRKELCEVAQAVMARFEHDADLMAYGVALLAQIFRAEVGDCIHGDAAAAVRVVLWALQRHPAHMPLQERGAKALAKLVEGNATATAVLCNPEAAAIMEATMVRFPHNSKILNALACVYRAMAGARGLLYLVKQESLSTDAQQAALLRAAADLEDCDVDTLLQLDAVGVLTARMQEVGLGTFRAPAAVAALGRVVEFLIQHCGPSSLVEQGVDAIVQRLRVEIGQRTPNIYIYADGLGALRNISRRSDDLAARISASPSVTETVELVFERNYWDLGFESLSQLLGALLLFAGFPRLCALLEKYPDGPIFHECACGVLREEAEREEGAGQQSPIRTSAASLAFYATKLLARLVPKAPNGEKLSLKAVGLLGHALCFVPDPAGPVLEDAVENLVMILRKFPKSSELASEACCALARVASANPKVLPVLAAHQINRSLLDLLEGFSNNAVVLCDAFLALGVLGGVEHIVQLMGSAPEKYAVQLAGCRAFAELARLGVDMQGEELRKEIMTAVGRAQASFVGPEHIELQSQAEMAKGLFIAAPQVLPAWSP